MRRDRTLLLVPALLLATAALTVVGCSASSSGGSTGGSAADPAGLVTARCTSCHEVSRIKGASHDAAGWTTTITRMRGKGAQLTDAEAQAVVDFLAGGGASKL